MKIGSSPLRHAVILLLLFLPGLLAACGAAIQADQLGQVQIDDVSFQILESFPVQVEVLIKGSLPDSCTEIERLDQRFDQRFGVEDGIFWIEIVTIRSTEEVCAQALVPFEETVSLEVYGLSAGTYVVDVNGTSETFTLDVENAPSDTELPNPASVYCQEQGNQQGFCVFSDGTECDEWAFFRGECGPAD
jgi:putative hemolysin